MVKLGFKECMECEYNNCKSNVVYDVEGCYILCLWIEDGGLRPFVHDDEYCGLIIKDCPLKEIK